MQPQQQTAEHVPGGLAATTTTTLSENWARAPSLLRALATPFAPFARLFPPSTTAACARIKAQRQPAPNFTS